MQTYCRLIAAYSHCKSGCPGTVPRGTPLAAAIVEAAARVISGLLCWLVLTNCSPGPSSRELVVGMDLSYPPFETIDENGKPTGISVELASALAKRLKLPLRIENIQFVGLIPSLQSGRIDCIISSMTDTPERRQAIAFTEPYLSIGLALLVGARSDIQSPNELDRSGRTIVVRQGTTGELWARANIKNAQVLSIEKENSASLEVIQGKADAFIYDQMSVWQNWKKNPETTRAILTPLQRENWAVGVRRGDDDLRARINEFLREYRTSGGFEDLGERYLGEQKEAFRRERVPFYF